MHQLHVTPGAHHVARQTNYLPMIRLKKGLDYFPTGAIFHSTFVIWEQKQRQRSFTVLNTLALVQAHRDIFHIISP